MDDEAQGNSGPSFNERLDQMMTDAWKEVEGDFSNGSGRDRVASAAKLVGKGTFYLGAKLIQNLPDALERMKEKQSK